MTNRKTILVNEHYYHIFNRGIARQPVFFNKRDYERLLLCFTYYQYKHPPVKLSRLLELTSDLRNSFWQELIHKKENLVEIISFVFMPNHFHLLLKQVTDNGISNFMSKSINSYTRYVNVKQERAGDLFQGVFKSVFVETDEQLLHLSRYIHINPYVSAIVKKTDLNTYSWSSLRDYLRGKSNIVKVRPILSHFNSTASYEDFISDQADYVKKQDRIKHLILE